jgi:hypothetical protein
LELLAEIFIQIVIMFCGIILVHRIITYIPTYSGFKYESLVLTNVILAFLILVLSIQTKLGLKVNILVDRVGELWNGPQPEQKGGSRSSRPNGQHNASKADYYDSPKLAPEMFVPPAAPKPPAQMASPSPSAPSMMDFSGPVAANGVLGGGSFGAYF